MVRTAAAGIKVSSGKSGKKGGGSSISSGSSYSKGGTSSSSNRLPSIPHTETPSWQKPITNFFGNKTVKKNTDKTNSSEIENEKNLNITEKGAEKSNKISDENTGTDKQESSFQTDMKENTENVEDNNAKADKSIENELPAKKAKTDVFEVIEESQIN